MDTKGKKPTFSFFHAPSRHLSSKFSGSRLFGSKAKRKDAYDYKWTSQFSHLCVTICMLLDPIVFCTELHTHQMKGSSDPVYIIILFIMVMPILYMEIFIGQYTQLCCLHYGKMAPLLHGLGAVKIIINFYILIQVLIYSATVTHYFSLIISEPWKKCQVEWMTGCLTLREIMNCRKTTCSNATIKNLSSYLYFKYYQEHKQVQKIFFTVAFGIIGCVTVMLGYHCYRYILLFSFVSIITTTTVMSLLILSFKSNIPVNLSKTTDSVTSLQYTTMEGIGNSITRPLITMNLAAAGHILYGTHLTTEIRTTFQIPLICLVYLICIGMGSFLIRLCYYSIISAGDWPDVDLSSQEMIYVSFHDFAEIHFDKIVIPLFFDLCCLILLFTKQVIHIDIICETMIGYFTFLGQHRVYVVSAVASVGLLSVIPYFLFGEMALQTVDTVYEFGSLIIIGIEMIGVMYIYSYTLFCDDIHFMFGSQPARVWKMAWLILPVVQIIGLLTYSASIEKTVTMQVLLTVSLSPLAIGALYRLIKAIKAKNVLGLFMPEEAWGMRNSLQRKLRHMYNPREETHSQTRDTKCKHDCLLDSEILNNVVRDEMESKHLTTMPREGNPFEDLSSSYRSEDDLFLKHSQKHKS